MIFSAIESARLKGIFFSLRQMKYCCYAYKIDGAFSCKIIFYIIQRYSTDIEFNKTGLSSRDYFAILLILMRA